MTQPVVFISYSHEDEEEKDELLSHLRVLKQAGLINIWSDDEIGVGTDWKPEIEQAMAQANVAILLVTANFLNSDFILGKEIPTLLKRREEEELIVFPVIAKACAWEAHDWLSQMNVRPKHKKPVWREGRKYVDEDLADIAREIFTTVKQTSDAEIAARVEKITSIIGLLNNGLNTESLNENVQALYNRAESLKEDNSEEAIELCTKALAILETGPSGDISALEALPYARGKFNLLLASIYLDDTGELKNAEKYFIESRNEFGARKWFHLEALAYLGLATTRRKLDNLDGAQEALRRANHTVDQESMADKVDKLALAALRAAIKEEDREIVDLTFGKLTPLSLPSPREQGPDKETTATPGSDFEAPGPSESAETMDDWPSDPKEKILPVFNILAGEGLITAGRVTDLNFLSCEDYEQKAPGRPEKITIALKKRRTIQYVDYLLQIGNHVNTDDDLAQDVWLPIQAESDPEELNGRTVAVLVKRNAETSVSLKTFIKAGDHYFLKAKSSNAASIVITHYQSDLQKINDYYVIDGENIVRKRADEIQISGAVYSNQRISKETMKGITETSIWQIPIVSHIAAGLEHPPIAKENVKDYVALRKDEPKVDDYFITIVEGDSMTGDGLLPGDKALIRQQENVDDGDIAAIVIKAPKLVEPLEVLKRYRVIYEQVINEQDRVPGHWRLESSNPLSEHLIVVPPKANIQAIKEFYTRQIEEGKLGKRLEIYEDADVVIAGKYIETVQ